MYSTGVFFFPSAFPSALFSLGLSRVLLNFELVHKVACLRSVHLLLAAGKRFGKALGVSFRARYTGARACMYGRGLRWLARVHWYLLVLLVSRRYEVICIRGLALSNFENANELYQRSLTMDGYMPLHVDRLHEGCRCPMSDY